MITKQYMIPGVGYVNEATTKDYLIPGSVYVNETQAQRLPYRIKVTQDPYGAASPLFD